MEVQVYGRSYIFVFIFKLGPNLVLLSCHSKRTASILRVSKTAVIDIATWTETHSVIGFLIPHEQV